MHAGDYPESTSKLRWYICIITTPTNNIIVGLLVIMYIINIYMHAIIRRGKKITRMIMYTCTLFEDAVMAAWYILWCAYTHTHRQRLGVAFIISRHFYRPIVYILLVLFRSNFQLMDCRRTIWIFCKSLQDLQVLIENIAWVQSSTVEQCLKPRAMMRVLDLYSYHNIIMWVIKRRNSSLILIYRAKIYTHPNRWCIYIWTDYYII